MILDALAQVSSGPQRRDGSKCPQFYQRQLRSNLPERSYKSFVLGLWDTIAITGYLQELAAITDGNKASRRFDRVHALKDVEVFGYSGSTNSQH